MDKDFLKQAIDQAKKSVKAGGFPAGSVIGKEGKIIAEGISIGYELHDPTSHAETAAIRTACQKLQTSDLSSATLYESLECCSMCFSVANWASISRIVYACRKTPEMVAKHYYEGSTTNQMLNENNTNKIELIFIPDFEKEMLELIHTWENK
jgi:tRNA(Arg) A34 adenosine deaminase TadA